MRKPKSISKKKFISKLLKQQKQLMEKKRDQKKPVGQWYKGSDPYTLNLIKKKGKRIKLRPHEKAWLDHEKSKQRGEGGDSGPMPLSKKS